MFSSILTNTTGSITIQLALYCTLTAIVCGVIIASIYKMEGNSSRNFTISLVILPVLIQSVIMMVNGNLGTSVAVLGTFGLVRFRSAPGTSKDICYVFFAMAIGLATGTGFIGFAFAMTLVVSLLYIILVKTDFAKESVKEKEIRILIPENLDYPTVFDDLFNKYTKKHELVRVKTSNMGALYDLRYRISLKDVKEEKQLIDEIRVRNGNLTVTCLRPSLTNEEL